jgi:MSHA biogenesis protein MshM
MYLEHFGFSDFPFTLTPNLNFFCELEQYKEALDLILISLSHGEGFIKVTGEVGTGKTLLCKKVLNQLGENYVTAYISNPNLDCFNLQKAIARELEIPFPDSIDQYGLLTILTDNFIKYNQENKRVVIIIDEAHVLSDATLDGLRLMSNLETETSKLIQILLVGQPELDKRLSKSNLRQLKQRIAFSYRLPTLSTKELPVYICHRLAKAGYSKPQISLFSPRAMKLIQKASCGIPRLVNILCHKSLLIGYGYNKYTIDHKFVKMAIHDTESLNNYLSNKRSTFIAILKNSAFVLALISLGILSSIIGILMLHKGF